MIEKEHLDQYSQIMSDNIEKATKNDHIIHGSMWYRCPSCSAVYLMHLEEGLEDRQYEIEGKGSHKPVPFTMPCIICGEFAEHVLWHADRLNQERIKYSELTKEPKERFGCFRNFFWNDPDNSCGVPILFKPDFEQSCFYTESEQNEPPKRHIIILPERQEPNENDEYIRTTMASFICRKEDEFKSFPTLLSSLSAAMTHYQMEFGPCNREERHHGLNGDQSWKRPWKNMKRYK